MTVEQIKAWLLSKGVTLWASWDLSQPERLHEAAVWFKAQMEECHKWVYTNPAYQWRMLSSAEVQKELWERPPAEYVATPGPEWDVV